MSPAGGADDDRDGAESVALLRVTVKDPDGAKVGRAFSNAAMEFGLASYPGFHLTAPPSGASPYGVYWPALVPSDRGAARRRARRRPPPPRQAADPAPTRPGRAPPTRSRAGSPGGGA